MPTGVVARDLPAGWELGYDGTRWFYTFTANGHVQYHFPSGGDEFPDFVDVTEPAPRLEPEGRLESHQQVRRVTGAAAASSSAKKKKKKQKRRGENGMTATAPRPVGIEWDGDVGGSSSDEEEEGGEWTVFEPENLMFLGPQVYADVSPLNEEEEEAAKRTVVGAVVGGVSPAETASAGTPATKRADPVTGDGEAAVPMTVSEIVEVQVVSMPPPAKEESTMGRGEGATTADERANDTEGPAAPAHEAVLQEPVPSQETMNAVSEPISPPPARQNVSDQVASRAPVTASQTLQKEHHEATPSPPQRPVPPPQAPTSTAATAEPVVQPRYELPAPDQPFNPVGVIAEMPTEDTPRSHIELNPIPVEIMDASVLAPIETAAASAAHTTSLGVAELPGQSSSANAVVRQTPPPSQQPPQQQRTVPAMMHMKIKRKPTAQNAVTPSALSVASPSSSAYSPAAAVSPPSVASAPNPPPPPTMVPTPPQYRPYAPVSPLQRAETEPVRVPPEAMQQQQQRRQSGVTTAPPASNPQLSYAPTVLRPAGRKSSSVSPERRQEGENTPAPMVGGGPVSNGAPEKVAPQVLHPRRVSSPGQGSLPGPLPQHVRALQPGPKPEQGMQPAGSQGQAQVPGPLPTHGQPPQRPASTQGQVIENGQRPPMQHGRPMSMMMPAAPGQYPAVPIPQPYGQYNRPLSQIHQQPMPPWMMPGQQAPGQQIRNQETPGQNFPAPPHQHQTPTSSWRQSMPPGYPQPRPNERHSMMAPAVPRKIPLDSQSQPAVLPNQQSVIQGPNSPPTTDSPVVSPLRSRAGSQPSGLSLPSPSPIETPQAQSTPSSQIPEQPKLGGVKIGTGAGGGGGSTAGQRRLATGSYFPPSKDHPIGLVGSIADQFAAEMQTLLGSEAQLSNPAQPTTTTATPEPKSLTGIPPPSSGHMLARIVEHEVVAMPAPGSASTTSVQPSPPPNTAMSQSQAVVPSKQTSLDNTLKPPQVSHPPSSELPGAPAQNAPVRIPSAFQAASPSPFGPQGSMPRPGAPQQQQWQDKSQQPIQRPPSVPPQIQMQPNKNKENRWTKWFKSSKPEKRPDSPPAGMLQQPPPQQPQQWHPGSLMPGHPVQRMSMQGPPVHGSIPGYPIQGQPAQRQSVHGQPLPAQPVQRLFVGGPQPPHGTPMQTHSPNGMHLGASQGPIPQTTAQQGSLGSHPPQQYMTVQSGQHTQTRPSYGAPTQEMYRPSASVSPAPSQRTLSQLSTSPSQVSISSLPPTGTPQPHPQIGSPMQSNLMPAPLSLRSRTGMLANGQLN